MASADSRWFAVAEAQLRRGAEFGTRSWRGGQKVLMNKLMNTMMFLGNYMKNIAAKQRLRQN